MLLQAVVLADELAQLLVAALRGRQHARQVAVLVRRSALRHLAPHLGLDGGGVCGCGRGLGGTERRWEASKGVAQLVGGPAPWPRWHGVRGRERVGSKQAARGVRAAWHRAGAACCWSGRVRSRAARRLAGMPTCGGLRAQHPHEVGDLDLQGVVWVVGEVGGQARAGRPGVSGRAAGRLACSRRGARSPGRNSPRQPPRALLKPRRAAPRLPWAWAAPAGPAARAPASPSRAPRAAACAASSAPVWSGEGRGGRGAGEEGWNAHQRGAPAAACAASSAPTGGRQGGSGEEGGQGLASRRPGQQRRRRHWGHIGNAPMPRAGPSPASPASSAPAW